MYTQITFFATQLFIFLCVFIIFWQKDINTYNFFKFHCILSFIKQFMSCQQISDLKPEYKCRNFEQVHKTPKLNFYLETTLPRKYFILYSAFCIFIYSRMCANDRILLLWLIFKQETLRVCTPSTRQQELLVRII